MNPAAFALLRLASPQLPIGGYSYSQGLEMAVEQQRVRYFKSSQCLKILYFNFKINRDVVYL